MIFSINNLITPSDRNKKTDEKMTLIAKKFSNVDLTQRAQTQPRKLNQDDLDYLNGVANSKLINVTKNNNLKEEESSPQGTAEYSFSPQKESKASHRYDNYEESSDEEGY